MKMGDPEEIKDGTDMPENEVEVKLTMKKAAIVRRILEFERPEFLPITDDVPLSYKSNSKREQKILNLAMNLYWQFRFNYPKRPNLFLFVENEYGIKKIVSTTICLTILPYPEMYMWNECAKFVAEYIQYVPLQRPTKFPLLHVSPGLVLKERKGNSLDLSVVLASLFIAAGYDAYIVCGYATRETCLLDETLKPCPLLLQQSEETSFDEIKTKSKYVVKPPADLSSKYEKNQQERKMKKEKESEQKKQEEELRRRAELEKPPPDPMYGQRVHFWILLISKDRDLEETFFVEPSTGEKRSLISDLYLGIEFVWNHSNFWINKQETDAISANFSFDLNDVELWEPFLHVDKNGLPIIQKDLEEEDVKPSVSYMPGSWVLPLKIPQKDFEGRFVGGTKVNYYKYVKTEKFSPYLLPNGLILKISIFKDRNYEVLKETQEHFQYRADLLYLRKIQLEEGIVHEHFLEGRKDHLKEFTSLSSVDGSEIERKMIYYSHVRADGLMKRYISPLHFSEEFNGRKDFLHSRDVDYQSEFFSNDLVNKENEFKLITNESIVVESEYVIENTTQQLDNVSHSDDKGISVAEGEKIEVCENISEIANQTSELIMNETLEKVSEKSKVEEIPSRDKEIMRVIEKFKRNRKVLADEDIEIKTFVLDEEYIRIDFHTPDERITSSYLEFIKPPAEKGSDFDFNDDMWSGFQADYLAKPFSKLLLYQLLMRLMEEEKIAIRNVQSAEKEVAKLLELRKQEDDGIHLIVLPYDPTRDNKVKEWREKQAKVLDKDILWKKRIYDVLTPYLARLDFPEKLSELQAKAVYEECLENFINRMITKANNVQKQLDKKKLEYTQKSDYLYHHRSHMTKKQKDEYADYFKKVDFKIKALEMSLSRHKETAHTRYLTLEKKLGTDPRLAPHVSNLNI